MSQMNVSPYSFAAGGIGAAFGALGAIKNNSNIKKQVRENYAAIDKAQTNAQQIGYQQQEAIGRQATYDTGAFINSLAGRSGESYRQVLAGIAADNFINSQNVKDNTQNQIQSLQDQKKNIFYQANSQMVSPIGAALTTGSSFFNQALQVEAAIKNAQLAGSAAEEAAAAQTIFKNADPAQIHALRSGLPATTILSGRLDTIINNDYNTFNETRTLNLEAAKAVRDYNKGLYK